MWNTAKTFLPKPLTIRLMTGNDIFNYVRRNRNRLNYRRKNCKYLLEKVQAQVESYSNLLLFFPCLSQISPAMLAWLPQKRLHGRIMFSNIKHQRKTKKKQNCFNRFRSLSSTCYFFLLEEQLWWYFDSVNIIHCIIVLWLLSGTSR